MQNTTLNLDRLTPVTEFAPKLRLVVGTASDREEIYRLRHEVYAKELGQHAVRKERLLRDSLDERNVYVVAKQGACIVGFISLTPPGGDSYSIDKYFDRTELPIEINSSTWEVRLLTVIEKYRGRELASLLGYAALRWIDSHEGRTIVAIGRQEIVKMYVRSGLNRTGLRAVSGSVQYEFLHASVAEVNANLSTLESTLERGQSKVGWELPMPFRKPAACFHGGAFFNAIGEDFAHLERKNGIVNADVLDAWFDPAPGVIQSLHEHLPWLAKTSPPTECGGLRKTIAQHRGLPAASILVGAGSSDLMFRVLPRWLRATSRVLLLDPTYGEYAHILEKVIGCQVDRLPLSRADGYVVPLAKLAVKFGQAYDLIILVNPNSPTGRHLSRTDLLPLLKKLAPTTRLWIDETYTDYVAPNESLEDVAADSVQIVICKSLSKVYALSGLRAAYLCGSPMLLEPLRAITPPWVVSLPAQVAAVRALQDSAYYASRYAETRQLREGFYVKLQALGMDVVPGCANFLLCHLREDHPAAAKLVSDCRTDGVFLRDASIMGQAMGIRAVRIAVKPLDQQVRILSALQHALRRGMAIHTS